MHMYRPTLLIVSATPVSPAVFVEKTPLGRSLRRLCFDDRLEMRPVFNSGAGLAAVYNRQIRDENRDKLLLFVRDDVWLDDFFICERLEEALDVFDLVGVAGCTVRGRRQARWDARMVEDPGSMSGCVGRGAEPGGALTYYGPLARKCALLEGAFLAARCRTLLEHDVRFDERFLFHHYDLDLCRTVEAKKLKVGTWPVSVTHAGVGDGDSPARHAALQKYLEKWGD